MPRHFTPATYSFLRDLAANNDRDWFAANKERYLDKVQEPALQFITDFGPRLAQALAAFHRRRPGGRRVPVPHPS
jgi:uncharacterized protein (DUF2461 family)